MDCTTENGFVVFWQVKLQYTLNLLPLHFQDSCKRLTAIYYSPALPVKHEYRPSHAIRAEQPLLTIIQP